MASVGGQWVPGLPEALITYGISLRTLDKLCSLGYTAYGKYKQSDEERMRKTFTSVDISSVEICMIRTFIKDITTDPAFKVKHLKCHKRDQCKVILCKCAGTLASRMEPRPVIEDLKAEGWLSQDQINRILTHKSPRPTIVIDLLDCLIGTSSEVLPALLKSLKKSRQTDLANHIEECMELIGR